MRFVRKRMTPPNLSLVSWIGISGGAKIGVDTAASVRINLGHVMDVYEVCRACFPILRSADAAARSTSEGAGTRRCCCRAQRGSLCMQVEALLLPLGLHGFAYLNAVPEGCATPLAPARGPRCKPRFELSCFHVVINSS